MSYKLSLTNNNNDMTSTFKEIKLNNGIVKTTIKYIVTKGNDKVPTDSQFILNSECDYFQVDPIEEYSLSIFCKDKGFNLIRTADLKYINEALLGITWKIDTQHGLDKIETLKSKINQIQDEYGLN